MELSLPFERDMIVDPVPTCAWSVNGRRADFFGVTPATSEIPVLDVSHCTACGCKAAGEVRSCVKPTCPSRPRKAA
jgi:hypothetical protein